MRPVSHYFFDGYEIDQELLSDPVKLEFKMRVILEHCSVRDHQIVTKNVEAGDFPHIKEEDTGISTVILFPGGHFTCHTYPHIGVVYVDLFHVNGVDSRSLDQEMCELLKPGHYDSRHERQESGAYGKHLVLEVPDIVDVEQGVQLVGEIRKILGMTKLMPMMVRSDAQSGVSNFDIVQPIVESHIALHKCLPGAVLVNTRGQYTIALDVFSCRDFSTEAVLQLVGTSKNVRQIPRGCWLKQYAR